MSEITPKSREAAEQEVQEWLCVKDDRAPGKHVQSILTSALAEQAREFAQLREERDEWERKWNQLGEQAYGVQLERDALRTRAESAEWERDQFKACEYKEHLTNRELRSDNVALRDALKKCCDDIKFWSEILAVEWPNFDGQLYYAMSQGLVALSSPSPGAPLLAAIETAAVILRDIIGDRNTRITVLAKAREALAALSKYRRAKE